METKIIDRLGSKFLGIGHERVKHPGSYIEKAISDSWIKENLDRNGTQIMKALLFKADIKLCNRDKLITSTIIQWLGSNVGMCFLRRSLNDAGFLIVEKDKYDELKENYLELLREKEFRENLPKKFGI